MSQIDTITDEAQIRQLVDNWTEALRAKNLDALMSHYTPDFLLYDLAPPLLHSGSRVNRKNLEEWRATFDAPARIEMRNLSVTTGDDVAYSTCLERITGRCTGGEQTDVCVRSTVGYPRIGGEWMIAHERSTSRQTRATTVVGHAFTF